MIRASVRLAAGLLTATLASCQGVPPASLPALATIDPLSLDPAALRAAVVHSDSVRLPPGTTALRLVLSDRNGAVLREEAFVLEARRATAADRLPPPAREERAFVLGIAAQDEARFSALQDVMRRRREAAPGTSSLAVSVSARPCLTVEGGDPRIAAFLATRPGGKFVPVTRTGPARRGLGSKVPRCAGEGA